MRKEKLGKDAVEGANLGHRIGVSQEIAIPTTHASTVVTLHLDAKVAQSVQPRGRLAMAAKAKTILLESVGRTRA